MRRRHLIPTLRRPHGFTVLALLTPKPIRERIGELTDRAQAIVDLADQENRDLTAEERKEVDEILGVGKKGAAGYKPGKIDDLEAQLERAEKLEARQAQLAASRGGDPGTSLHERQDGPACNQEDRPLVERLRIPATARYRHHGLRAFRGQHAEQTAFLAGQFFLASIFRNDRARQWCSDHGLNIRAALSTDADSLGGFLVPTEVEQTIIDLREQYGVARQLCNVVPMARDVKDHPYRSSGVTAYFVGDNTEITASDKAWGNARLVAKKLGALVKYSSELDEDSIISIGDDLTSEIAYAFAVKEDQCLISGDGTSTYGGIVGLTNAVAAGSIYNATAGNTAFSTLDLDDFENVVGKLPQYPGQQPVWLISKPGWAASMMRLLDAAGGNTVSNLEAGGRQMFLGYPVVWSPACNSTLTVQASTVLLFFGDLRQAVLLGNRRGVSVQISDQRYFEYDQLGIKGTERFDLTVHSTGDASNAGAVVALKTPAS